MSSTEITSCEDARNRTTFPLPIELRVKIYEQLLVRPDGSLKPVGHRLLNKLQLRKREKSFISILLINQTIYEEALPILYGNNVLAFHHNGDREAVLPFPEEHLFMVKHVEVEMNPWFYCNAEKTGDLLMLLGTRGANLVDINIRIGGFEPSDFNQRVDIVMGPVLNLSNWFLDRDNPLVVGLFSLKMVKKLAIQTVNHVRFEPGVANALKEAFITKGTVIGRSIAILKTCTSPIHTSLQSGEICPRCGNVKESLVNGIGDYDCQDDITTRQLYKQFLEHKQREAARKAIQLTRAKNSLSDRSKATKKSKARFANDSSRRRASENGP